jgi:glutathione synthase/RimK-type ligase-like ATP-grasp enzyme
LLKSIAGIEIPATVQIDRKSLQQIYRGEKFIISLAIDGDFPIIVRPVGSHAGKGLAKLDNPAGILAYLETNQENIFHTARFVDYKSADGLYRKYRITLIDGQPFVCHMAISEDWMIHYKNAGMSESAAKRDEEASFMANFDADFAQKHKDAFRLIHERLQLNYLVIDCGENHHGELLIFEADNIGFVHAMDPVDIYPYKRPQMRKVFDAFYAMLRKSMLNGEHYAALLPIETPSSHSSRCYCSG